MALTLSFIFGQSMIPGPQSIEKSDVVADKVDNLFAPELVPKPVEPTPDESAEPDKAPESTPPSEDSATTPPSEDSSTTPPSEDSSTTPPSEDSDTTLPSEGTDNTAPEQDSEQTTEPEIIYEEKPRPFIDFVIKNIRKIAHFVEHGIFALEVFFFLLALEKAAGTQRKIMPIGVKTLIITLNIGILTAFFDESIQILSERTYSVVDMWIDIAGYASFTALVTVIYVIIKTIIFLIKTFAEHRKLAWDWH